MNRYAHPVSRSNQRGFSLLEVLIAAVVLAAGLLALTALQGALMRNSADAKARSQLAALAQSVMDEARSSGYGAIPVGASVQLSTMNDPNRLTRAARAMGVATVTENSTVTEVVNGTLNYKVVNFRLSWNDATGGARSLRLNSVISPLLLVSGPLTQLDPPESTSFRPIVRRPTPVTDGMIPIALGNNEDTAATNPKPQLLGGSSGTYVSDTAFDVLTYNTADNLGNSNFVRFDKRIETRVVGCTCQDNSDGFDVNGQGSEFLEFLGLKAFRPTYWNGEKYEEPTIAAVPTVSSSPADASQSELCQICCRDHKDPSGQAGPKFSPWTGQDASHVVATDGTYSEACRVIRVGGVFRVAADPKIQDIAMVPTRDFPAVGLGGSPLSGVGDNTSATSPSVDSAGLNSTDSGTTAYIDYVFDFVKQVFYTGVLTADPYNVDAAAMQQAHGLNAPDYIPMRSSGDRRWMHNRALVTDFLEPVAVQRIVRAKTVNTTGSPCTGSSDQDLARCVLPYSPLATVNVTEIANWAPRSATVTDVQPASLASLALNLNYLNYAKATIRRYNTGLALTGAVNVADAASPALDEQLFVRLSATPPASTPWMTTPNPNPTTARSFGNASDPMRGYGQSSAPIPFLLSWNFPSGNPSSPVTSNIGDPTGTVITGTDCSLPVTNNNNTNPHECNTSDTGAFVLELKGYNRTEFSDVNNPCGSGKVSKPACVVYTYTGASVNNPAATILSPAYPPFSGTQGKKDEVIRISVPGVASTPASTVTVNFSRSQPATTYTCVGATPVWTVPCE